MIVVIIKMKAIQNIVRIVDLSQSLKYWLKVSFPFLASTFLRGDGSRHSYHVVPLMLATDPKFMFFFPFCTYNYQLYLCIHPSNFF